MYHTVRMFGPRTFCARPFVCVHLPGFKFAINISRTSISSSSGADVNAPKSSFSGQMSLKNQTQMEKQEKCRLINEILHGMCFIAWDGYLSIRIISPRIIKVCGVAFRSSLGHCRWHCSYAAFVFVSLKIERQMAGGRKICSAENVPRNGNNG